MASFLSNHPAVTENEESSSLKALENTLILKKISTFLPLTDLKEFRQVNTLWNQGCLPVMQKRLGFLDCKFVPKIISQAQGVCAKKSQESDSNSDSESDSKIGTELYVHQKPPASYDRLINLIKNCTTDFPFSKFLVKTQNPTNPFLDQQLFTTLLPAISDFATELEMQLKIFWFNPPNANNLKFQNLQYLTISLVSILKPDPEYDQILTNFVWPIIANAPKLKTVHLQVLSMPLGMPTTANQSITKVKTLDNLLAHKITSLQLTGLMGDNFLLAFSKLNPLLRKLSLTFHRGSRVSSANLKLMLEQHAANLQELNLASVDENVLNHSPREISFPTMQTLKRLEIHSEELKFPGFSFKQHVPSLKHLVLDTDRETVEEFISFKVKATETVDILELSGCWKDPNFIQEIARIFPSLKKLAISCGKQVLLTLDGLLKNLEELTLDMMHSEERGVYEALTGCSRQELKKFRKLQNAGKTELAAELANDKEPLAFMKNLKVLRLNVESRSNVVALLGLLKLESQTLLEVHAMGHVDDDVLVQMTTNFRVVLKRWEMGVQRFDF